MHGVNLDLLRATATHHPDGTAKDPHAHHRAELRALARATRRQLWLARLTRFRTLFPARAARHTRACSEQTP